MQARLGLLEGLLQLIHFCNLIFMLLLKTSLRGLAVLLLRMATLLKLAAHLLQLQPLFLLELQLALQIRDLLRAPPRVVRRAVLRLLKGRLQPSHSVPPLLQVFLTQAQGTIQLVPREGDVTLLSL